MACCRGDLSGCPDRRNALAPPAAGTAAAALPFGGQEVAMIKAPLTPILLGLFVALLIRVALPRRAY